MTESYSTVAQPLTDNEFWACSELAMSTALFGGKIGENYWARICMNGSARRETNTGAGLVILLRRLLTEGPVSGLRNQGAWPK